MNQPSSLMDKHRQLLDGALDAIAHRHYWTPFSEMPSPKIYGENAAEEGKQAFQNRLNKAFALNQPGEKEQSVFEKSPYGIDLGVSYSKSDPDLLLQAAQKAMTGWQALGAEGRTGICLEILTRINKRSFEIANAVMMTSGQGYMMAFQAGGPHAQDRALEAVAYAYREQSFVPAEAIWEKPQGKHPSIKMKKHFEIVGKGIGVVVGCCTFPTWNTYPGLFASLATGNAVVVKPHPQAILPAAITIEIIRDVLTENAIDPNLVTLFVTDKDEETQTLLKHALVKTIDFTGSTQFGTWLQENCKQAQVYAEMAGVNSIVIDSTDQYAAMIKNLAFTLMLYSGQMCTTSQAIFIPEAGIETDEGHKSIEMVEADLAKAVQATVGKPEMAVAIFGAIQGEATEARIQEANSGAWGKVVLSSEPLTHPEFPNARIHSPVILSCNAQDKDKYQEERFGPISFLIKTANTDESIQLMQELIQTQGALTLGLYSRDDAVIDKTTQASWQACVALSINLTGAVFVNQSAAFSDFHGTGGNPAANASYADSAFVANRFRVVQRRYHI